MSARENQREFVRALIPRLLHLRCAEIYDPDFPHESDWTKELPLMLEALPACRSYYINV